MYYMKYNKPNFYLFIYLTFFFFLWVWAQLWFLWHVSLLQRSGDNIISAHLWLQPVNIYECLSVNAQPLVSRLISLSLSASDDATPNQIKAQSPAVNGPWPVPSRPDAAGVTDEPQTPASQTDTRLQSRCNTY